MKITCLKNGPLLIGASLFHPVAETVEGEQVGELKEAPVALCRCGQSGNKPFCDGAHKAAGFEAVQVELESEAAGCCVD